MSKIKIYQIYYHNDQLSNLDPTFIPFNNSDNPRPELREFFIFQNAYHKNLPAQANLTGFLSWKFNEKTGIEGKKFIDFINKNPGYDVYFINPYPHELRFRNAWQQGEHYHPGILKLATSLFDDQGISIDLNALLMNHRNLLYCNYWVGTPNFWDRYMKFCEPLYHHILNLPPEKFSEYFTRADQIINASFFPFIFERLFSTLLATDKNIQALAYDFSWKEISHNYKRLDKAAFTYLLKTLDNYLPHQYVYPLFQKIAKFFYKQK